MKNLLLDNIKEVIVNSEKKDVYAVSLYLEYYNDNVYEPTITVSYNTNMYLEECVKDGIDFIEAKWNYAYWAQNELYVFGLENNKEEIKKWFVKNNFGYLTYDEFFSQDIDETLIEEIDTKIKSVLVEVVKELHVSQFIKKQFGNEIPVVIHELEYSDKTLEINKAANPEYLISEFEKMF